MTTDYTPPELRDEDLVRCVECAAEFDRNREGGLDAHRDDLCGDCFNRLEVE